VLDALSGALPGQVVSLIDPDAISGR